MSNRINGVVVVIEMGEGWEKRKFFCGGGGCEREDSRWELSILF